MAMENIFFEYFELNIYIEIILVGISLIILLVGVFSKQSKITNFYLFIYIIIFFLLTSIYILIYNNDSIVSIYSYYYLFENNIYINVFKIIIYILTTIVCYLLISSFYTEISIIFEFLVILLLAVVGMVFFLSSIDFLMSFVALELQTIALYILAASKRNSKFATEAALKYFIFSAFSSVLFIFGCSFIYGILGTTNFQDIKMLTLFIFSTYYNLYYLGLLFGILLVFISFFLKLGVVPFHLWVTDVYEGIPSYVLMIFALVSKVAILGFFAKLYYNVFINFGNEFENLLLLLSILSIFVGSLGAVKQIKLKRLIAYSSVTHIGFMLLPLATSTLLGFQAFLIYLILYLCLTLNLFLILVNLKIQDSTNLFNFQNKKTNTSISKLSIINYILNIKLISQSYLILLHNKTVNSSKHLKIRKIYQFINLFKERRLLALFVALILFSFAGIPPLAGFFSKLYILICLVQRSWFIYAIIVVSLSVIASFYYIRLVKIMFFDSLKKKTLFLSKSTTFQDFPLFISILFIITNTVNLGFFCYPWFIDLLTSAMIFDLLILPKIYV